MARQHVDTTEDDPANPALPSAIVRVQLLGGFRLEVGSHSVDEFNWRLRKARSLVKLLALAPRHRMHREQVLDLLWPDHDPEAAGNNLRSTLHVARRMLEQHAGPVPAIAVRADYLFLFPDHDVWSDVEAFEDAATAARLTRDPDSFLIATSHYRGELLPEDRYEPWAEERRERLRLTWLSLLRDLTALYEQRGEQRSAIDVLLQMTSAEPADEAAHVALMRLYAQTGQRLQALRQYQHLRDQLQQVLDVEPEPESTRLYEDILAGRFDTISPATEPPVTTTVIDDHRPSAPPILVPVELTSFVGRVPELDEICDLVRRSRLVTLTGPGGSGKTRLAIAAARRRADEFVGGVWFVDLAPLADPALGVAEVAGRLGVAGQADRSLIDDVGDVLRDRSALIVLDNCEHLIDTCAGLADALLRAAASLTILATSR
ncbi:MAG TPA: BTAD domain-containing putative transcriptional regulator, partial [Thermomicrobiales bacterium]|nr:BTAD domain-containing putative transcriptional regulator [Thermomicrobiales bacterium]